MLTIFRNGRRVHAISFLLWRDGILIASTLCDSERNPVAASIAIGPEARVGNIKMGSQEIDNGWDFANASKITKQRNLKRLLQR